MCYSRVQKSIENFVFRPKMAIFQRAGMREGGLPLPIAFQYLILMIWRACDLNLLMISLLASKCQYFKLRGLQCHYIKQLKNGHYNFKDLLFWSQIQITSSSYQILREWQHPSSLANFGHQALCLHKIISVFTDL